MEKCYTYFNCDKTECIIFQNKDEKICWETEGTLCFFKQLTPIIKEANKKEKCNYCLYKDHMIQKETSVKFTQQPQ